MAIQDFTAGQVLTAAQMDSLQANDYNWTVSTKTASYTLAAADKGTRIAMNSASATTITVNTSIFAAGDILWIQNINSGTCTITAGTCTVNTAGSLALAQWQGGTLYFTSASTAIFFLAGSGASYGTATGGIGAPTSVTIGGINYQYLTFTSTGTLTITKAGLFDVWLGAGGGSGGASDGTNKSGGGGAGGVMQATVYLSANTTVTIGAGGAGSTTSQNSGSYSSLDNVARSISVAGGGAAGGYLSAIGNYDRGRPGGSGGGGNNQTATQSTVGQPSVAPSVQGFAGGDSANGIGSGGGGGGATAVGVAASGTIGGDGGAGYDVSAFIGGSALYKAGGGGGSGTTGGAGGSGVGGSKQGGSAAANTASGGAGTNTGAGGSGGSGIVYVRFKV